MAITRKTEISEEWDDEARRRRREELLSYLGDDFPDEVEGVRVPSSLPTPEERIAEYRKLAELIGKYSCGGNSVEDIRDARRG